MEFESLIGMKIEPGHAQVLATIKRIGDAASVLVNFSASQKRRSELRNTAPRSTIIGCLKISLQADKDSCSCETISSGALPEAPEVPPLCQEKRSGVGLFLKRNVKVVAMRQ